MRNLEFHPLTPARWPDLEKLFGERGACGGCWCMWWRLTRSEWERNKGTPNKTAFRKLVDSKAPLGVLAFLDGQPIGWCAIAPRETLPSLARSRVLAPVDDQPVWSVTCFFVARPYRRRGVAVRLLKAAVEYARSQGGASSRAIPPNPASRRCPMFLPSWARFRCSRRPAFARSRGGRRTGRLCGSAFGRHGSGRKSSSPRHTSQRQQFANPHGCTAIDFPRPERNLVEPQSMRGPAPTPFAVDVEEVGCHRKVLSA